jgi:hypothetical protein
VYTRQTQVHCLSRTETSDVMSCDDDNDDDDDDVRDDQHSHFHGRLYDRLLVQRNRPSCTSTKSNLHFADSLQPVFKVPDLYRLVILQVPNLMSIFRCLGLSKESVQVQDPV